MPGKKITRFGFKDWASIQRLDFETDILSLKKCLPEKSSKNVLTTKTISELEHVLHSFDKTDSLLLALPVEVD